MKAIRGLKKQKNFNAQDSQRIAEEKLAILSDQVFLEQNDKKNNPESWTISSFNLPSRPNQLFLLNDQTQLKNQKLKEKAYSSFQNKHYSLFSEQLSTENRIKKYLQQHCQQESPKINKNEEFFQQKKSLSLTSYILFDKKRRPSVSSQKTAPKSQYQRLKILQVKKLLSMKRDRKNKSFYEKSNLSQPNTTNFKTHINFHHSSYEKAMNKELEQIQKDKNKKNKQRSFQVLKKNQQIQCETDDNNCCHTEATKILSNIIKRKDVPNMNIKKYNRQYELIKQKKVQSVAIQSVMNSTKAQLHEYYKKFIY